MTQGSKKVFKTYIIGMIWILGLIWPLLGIHPDGTLTFGTSLTLWLYIVAGSFICLVVWMLNKNGGLAFATNPIGKVWVGGAKASQSVPTWIWLLVAFILAVVFPLVTGRYQQDVAINVLIYVCLGLGLNVVVGLSGMLDLGYIAFYGVGAYTYALLNIHFGIPFWFCVPISAIFALLVASCVGYPTLRMRGDYLAIVTLGFGEIIRIILNNWMTLTNGPNGLMGINRPGIYWPSFADGFSLEHLWLKKLWLLYYVALGLAIITIIGVHRLNFSRIGRAWESIREDETAAELMGVNTFIYKLLAYAMGGAFAGMAGAFFASRMKFVSPESFTFLESAMVLCMVVLGGMGSIPGVILGAAALIILPEVFRDFELYRMLAFGAVMVLMMLFRPKGLIPAKRMGHRSDEREE
ncbi:MAG: high-affinity branched-chain amino acid ABC transporter permease LivM [Desulfuromusa sp.]